MLDALLLALITRRHFTPILLSVLAVFFTPKVEAYYVLPQDSAGWSIIGPSSDTRTYYVCTDNAQMCNNSNNGLSPSTAFRSISFALTKLRNGYPDHVLLKRGNTFYESLTLRLSGRSATQPILIGTYGSMSVDRPVIATTQTGSAGLGINIFGSYVSNLAIVGIHFKYLPVYPAGNFGIRVVANGSNFLVEDCMVEGYFENILFSASAGIGLDNVTLRRSVIVDAHAAGYGYAGKAEGIYSWGTQGLLIEENVFDHNGWLDPSIARYPANEYSHNIYTGVPLNSSQTIIRNNIVARGSSGGVMIGPGGSVQNNLIVNNSIGIYMNGMLGEISGNAIIEGKQIDPNAQGNVSTGINLVSLKSTDLQAGHQLRMFNNVIANDSVPIANAFHFETRDNINFAALTQFVPFQTAVATGAGNNAFFDWPRITEDGVGELAYPREGNWPDPHRSVETYNSEVLHRSASMTDFLSMARLQRNGNWNPSYTGEAVSSYILAGFNIGQNQPNQPTPTPAPALRATSYIQAESYNSSKGIGLAPSSAPTSVGYTDASDWIEFNAIDFGTGVTHFQTHVAEIYSGRGVQVRIDSLTGPLVANLSITPTSSWASYSVETVPVSYIPRGVHRVYFVFTGSYADGNYDWFHFY